MASTSNGATGSTSAEDLSIGKNDAKVTAVSYGSIDTSGVKEEAWLLRIPPKLAQAWQDAPEGTVLGDLVFTKGGAPMTTNKAGVGPKQIIKPTKPSFTVNVAEEFSKNRADLPLKYSFEAMTKRVPALHPFTRRSDGSIALHGTVTRSANLQMQRTDERYRKLCQNRLVQSNVKSNRYVRPVETNELSVRKSHSAALTKSMTGFGNAVQKFGKSLMDASEGSIGDNPKKRKFEGQSTRSVVFEMFSQQIFWTVKEMRSTSGRPEKEIRDVLQKVAEFHRSGEYKNKWELRKEFQKQDGN